MISILLFLIPLVLGFPIYIALLISGMYVLVFQMGMNASAIVLILYDGVAKFTLAAVPMFLLAGAILDNTTMGRRLVNFIFSMVKHIRGGVPISGVLASEMFGSLSGSAAASTGTVGKILYPEISKKEGESFALGLLTSCGALAVIMPPSISMIIYGATAQVSTGTLFMTGIVPALIIGVLVIGFILWRSRKHEKSGDTFSLKSFILNSKNAFWVLFLPIIVLGGIYSGIFTPTEAASVAAFYALVVAVFLYKEMGLKSLYNSLKEALTLTTQIFIVIAASVVFSHALTLAQVPQTLMALTSELSPLMFILIVNIILLIMGMFLDTASAILVLTPLLMPIALNLGIDLIHLGLLIVVNLAIGLFTPPFGLNLFVSQSVFRKPMSEVVIGLRPFWVWYFTALLLISYFPQLFMWIPEVMK